jgi:hypothetical protein
MGEYCPASVASTKDDDARGPSRTDRCADCGAPFASDQRYCISCGARRGPLPQAIAAQISLLLRRWRLPDPDEAKAAAGAAAAAAAAAKAGTAKAAEPEAGPSSFMPSPRVAAIAVMGMLALGVLLGSATSQVAQSAGISAILFESAAKTPPAEEPAEEPVETASAEPAPVEEAAPSATYYEEPAAEEAPAETPSEEPELVPFNPEEEETSELPSIKHVFLIVLGENGYEETFGETSTSPYLSETLPEQGELLKNYYAVTGGVLANEIALLSGQGPTLETAADCPTYTDIAPGTESSEESSKGQVEGDGCVYPATTETIASQLAAKELTWRAYVEDMENGALTGQPTSCRHPELGAADPNQAPVEGDAYVTWRNPFVYFHSIIDGEECATNDLGLEALTADLRNAKRTPTLSYIVPDACHSGGETACAEGQPTGALATEEFLKRVVPAITASEAYKEDGLIAITSAQAPQAGEHADPGACCLYPEYLNVSAPEETEEEAVETGIRGSGGGGKVGMLLISPFVKAGSVNEESKYNHFSFLLTLEELFELEKLGYAQEPTLTPFDSSVFNYAEEEESTVTK